jgi:hypothetical protein
MAKGIGKLFQIGIAKETTRGTARTTASYWPAFTDAAPEEKYENAIDSQSYGVIEDSASQTRTKNWMEGTINAPLSDQSFVLFLLSLLGTDTPTTHAGETVVYDHALTVAQNAQHQSLTVFVHDPLSGQDYSHALGVVHKVDIEYALKDFVKYSASIMAQQGAAQSAFSPSQTAENRFVPQYLTFKTAANLAGLAAATPIAIKSLKLTIDDNVESQDVLGNVAPVDFLNKEFKIEGTLEAIWQNESDFKTNAIANTPQALRLDLINNAVTLGTAAHPEIKIDLAKVYFSDFSRPIKTKDLVYQTVKFKAAYSISDAQMVKITCTNTVASY